MIQRLQLSLLALAAAFIAGLFIYRLFVSAAGFGINFFIIVLVLYVLIETTAFPRKKRPQSKQKKTYNP
ncbi:hypothetical protein [Alkalicoccus luteus]|uniref:Uncharacterized protein n=1 Tax=Alkalicoccus luteus TaxID=1237094 RepID=A0A969PQ77_9BACI|nr:hypothetical protein [Alkalicoccus luteus]NJP35973.1 hypothetical protein [Alkalicoccus luteus]